MPSLGTLLLGLAAALLLAGAGRAVADDDLFELTVLPTTGRSVAAKLADFDGDGRLDLFVGMFVGLPPDDRRLARVHLQRADGSFPSEPSFVKRLPDWSGVYDVEDVRADSPGHELVILVPDGVVIESLASETAPSWKLTAPGSITMAPSADERGLEPFHLVQRHLGPPDDGPWLLVPQIGRTTALAPDGAVRAVIEQPRRTNYFILPPTGLVSLESDYQIFVDAPKLLLGDIDGDGRNDIASATRHEIWVSLQRPDGSFALEPDQKLALRMVTPRDHVRGSGGVSTAAGDVDGDGRLDLVVSHVKGGFSDATTTVFLYLNRTGRWRLDAPDQTIVLSGTLASNALLDMDRDSRVELVRLQFSFSLLEVIEILVSRTIDLELSIWRYDGKAGFEAKPWVSRKVGLPISFETFRTKGFVPNAQVDLNGDGFVDVVMSGSGDEIVFHAGGSAGPLQQKPVRQKMSTAGMITFGDWSGDGLLDFAIFDPHNYDVPVRLGRNLGRLPGTRAGMRAPE
ncbi:MAG TPA: VCBS repeat-containing protein [Planctomycetota bacterium]|nr:VCBS repeat-containing protein [Planctomycetota bacterium]